MKLEIIDEIEDTTLREEFLRLNPKYDKYYDEIIKNDDKTTFNKDLLHYSLHALHNPVA